MDTAVRRTGSKDLVPDIGSSPAQAFMIRYPVIRCGVNGTAVKLFSKFTIAFSAYGGTGTMLIISVRKSQLRQFWRPDSEQSEWQFDFSASR